MSILNLTQHTATTEQQAAGVVDPADKKAVQALITFSSLPTMAELRQNAKVLADIAEQGGFEAVMVGGAGYFMPYLESALAERGITALHAFTVRETVETHNTDGTVTKTAVFKHAGFVTANANLYV